MQNNVIKDFFMPLYSRRIVAVLLGGVAAEKNILQHGFHDFQCTVCDFLNIM